MSALSVLNTCFFLRKEQKCIDYRTARQSNPVWTLMPLGAARFTLPGLLQLDLRDSVQ